MPSIVSVDVMCLVALGAFILGIVVGAWGDDA